MITSRPKLWQLERNWNAIGTQLERILSWMWGFEPGVLYPIGYFGSPSFVRGFVHTTLEEFENGGEISENASTVYHPHYAGGIWKWRFLSENTSNVFLPHYAGEFIGHFGFVWGKLGLGNHMIIVKTSFSKSSVFKIFSLHTKTQSRRFQIPPVWRAFSNRSIFVTD